MTSDEKDTTADDGAPPIKSSSSPTITITKSPLEIESGSAPHHSNKGTSRRVLRSSTNPSEDDADERRTVLITPLTQDRGKAMGAGERFMRNFRGSYLDEERGDSGGGAGVHMYRLQATTMSNKGFCEVNCDDIIDLF